MKQIKYYIWIAACALALTSCMGGENLKGEWDAPDFSGGAPFGNNAIQETNVITIQELLDKYPNVYEASDKNKLIEEDIQIKGRITGNSVEGNIYKQFALQDKTAGIIVCVDAGDLHGYLLEGQEVLIDLKGLYIGGYGQQPEIGMPYNGTSIGRMPNSIWQKHFKLVGDVNPDEIQPVDFSTIKSDKKKCARLVTIKDVSFQLAGKYEKVNGVDRIATFAPDDEELKTGGAVNRSLNEQGYKTTVVIRTSTYANFAAMPLPYDVTTMKAKKCNLTGIATRYKDDWQLLIRKTSDIDIVAE